MKTWRQGIDWTVCIRWYVVPWVMGCHVVTTAFAVTDYTTEQQDDYMKISVVDYQQKVYASWLGQMVGNFYGLPHENAYIEEAGPEAFPFGYTKGMVEQFIRHDGGFSDDDTDIEYLYMMQMEKHGVEPTYAQLADAWKYHIMERVWLANRAALGLMHVGLTPPFTGMKACNPHWFQIDPQLVNEVWAVTAPGMVDYAVQKSEWAARITNDDWGVDPTIHYAAMYAAAFFESDVYKLIDIGTEALPEGSRFAETVGDMKALYNKYPNDWKTARKEMAEKYYHREPMETKTIWNANLNGACGILALLYGGGDFQKTLDMAVVMGFDADNQTATMCGLVALINGEASIPGNLLFPVPNWDQPFNDRYINITRHDMPSAGIRDIASRMASLGEQVIIGNGGKRITEGGKDYYLISKAANFISPLELPIGPDMLVEVGKPVHLPVAITGSQLGLQWEVLKGRLPQGLRFEDGYFIGTPEVSGQYVVEVQVAQSNQKLSRELKLVVLGHNQAHDAVEILANVNKVDVAARDSLWLTVSYETYANDIETIRDGVTNGSGSTFYSIDGSSAPKSDYYGYRWTTPVNIDFVVYHTGAMEEISGWFTSIDVEYQDDSGSWKSVEGLVVSPQLPEGNQPYNKPHFVAYQFAFKPVRSTAICLVGQAGGGKHWNGNTAYFTSISELGMYQLNK